VQLPCVLQINFLKIKKSDNLPIMILTYQQTPITTPKKTTFNPKMWITLFEKDKFEAILSNVG
jgi:hypothetical protein